MSGRVILIALADECAAEALAPHRVVYTGVGKVNAALAAAEALGQGAREIVNFGSAGAVTPGLSGLIEVGAAVQRDMDLRPLGLPLGETLGEKGPGLIRWAGGPVIGTGDSFADAPPELGCDLVDMEAYAIAKACARAGAGFRCLKWISDAADADAPGAWEVNKAKGAAAFAAWLKAAWGEDA